MYLQFSIIIPVYNRPQEIDELLQSIAEQSFQKDFEVVIVEDGSIDKCDVIADLINVEKGSFVVLNKD